MSRLKQDPVDSPADTIIDVSSSDSDSERTIPATSPELRAMGLEWPPWKQLDPNKTQSNDVKKNLDRDGLAGLELNLL